MNIVYLYLHQIMMRYANNNILTKKEIFYIIDRHFKFANNINKDLRFDLRKIIKKTMLDNMCKLKLLEKIKTYKIKGGYNLKIINPERSASIDKGLLANILTMEKGVCS